jgi:microcin C transport system ATP-binding protein
MHGVNRRARRIVCTVTGMYVGGHGLTYLFISHDLKVVLALAHEVVVMRNGKIVEQGPSEQIFKNPCTDYTRELIAAALELRARDAA